MSDLSALQEERNAQQRPQTGPEVVRKNMMDRREMIKEYKNSIQPMGIVQVRNIRNNRV
jgi:hypothetical protein